MDALNPDTLIGGSTFTSNRATGQIALAVSAACGTSRRSRVHEAGSLRVRFPNLHDTGALEAAIVNTAGGMAGGDCFDIDIEVGPKARLTVTTVAAEKIYRSLGPDTDISVKLSVRSGAAMSWLPQETILFDQARLRRTIEVDLATDAQLLLAEAIVFGRAAMGEIVDCGHVFDRWRVRVGGTLVFAEMIQLDGAIAHYLAQPAVAADGAAVASVLKFPGGDRGDKDAVKARVLQRTFASEVGVSSWNGFALARLIAPDGAALRRDLVALLTLWSGGPLPRLWLS
jgi:urease accessory protein